MSKRRSANSKVLFLRLLTLLFITIVAAQIGLVRPTFAVSVHRQFLPITMTSTQGPDQSACEQAKDVTKWIGTFSLEYRQVERDTEGELNHDISINRTLSGTIIFDNMTANTSSARSWDGRSASMYATTDDSDYYTWPEIYVAGYDPETGDPIYGIRPRTDLISNEARGLLPENSFSALTMDYSDCSYGFMFSGALDGTYINERYGQSEQRKISMGVAYSPLDVPITNIELRGIQQIRTDYGYTPWLGFPLYVFEQAYKDDGPDWELYLIRGSSGTFGFADLSWSIVPLDTCEIRSGHVHSEQLTCEPVQISALQLNDVDDTPLEHLSGADHTYFNGNTRVHGTITVEGAQDDELESLELEVVQSGAVVARAQLADGASNQLLRSFGPAQRVSISASQLIFELPSDQAAQINDDEDGTVLLRVRARTSSGTAATRNFGNVTILTRYAADNRYGGRDAESGGDDWVLPNVNDIIADIPGIQVGDISNMNGGRFPPHAGHQDGNQFDGWFEGYNARDAATAAVIIGHLNNPDFGAHIARVYVTYDQVDTNPFWNAIRNVRLNDGRQASAVIRPVAGHTTHFHYNIVP